MRTPKAAHLLLSLLLAPGLLRADAGLPQGAPPSLVDTRSSVERAERVREHILRHENDEARAELAGGDSGSPALRLARAMLAIHETDCDAAVTLLATPDLAKSEPGEALADVARGCARVVAAAVVERDDAHHLEIRYQDEDDRALGPLLVETAVKARDALTKDLGATWPPVTRITVVRDLMSLSAMTGLPREAAMTTGTVAIAKWGRVTLLSPRASHHGYSWRDTLAHELTHLAISRATADRAPLWLQEGVAKREEVRWRDPGPFDDRPSPEAVVVRGMQLKLDLPLDKLGPSIAMLPSADAAMVAFAEVTSFVRLLASTTGPDTLPRLFMALRDGKRIDEALVEATGAGLGEWDAKWRASLKGLPKGDLSDLFGLGRPPSGTRDARERARLTELLYGRGHYEEALVELDRIKGKELEADPGLRHLRGRVLEALGRPDQAEPLVADPKAVAASHGPWWALRGRLARARGDDALAAPSFVEAVAADPYDVEAACETLDKDVSPAAPAARILCEAARKVGEPGLGQD